MQHGNVPQWGLFQLSLPSLAYELPSRKMGQCLLRGVRERGKWKRRVVTKSVHKVQYRAQLQLGGKVRVRRKEVEEPRQLHQSACKKYLAEQEWQLGG